MSLTDAGHRLSLEELATLVKDVARERDVPVQVAAAIPTEGEGSYAEVVVERQDQPERLSIGLRRDEPIADLRRQIALRLSER